VRCGQPTQPRPPAAPAAAAHAIARSLSRNDSMNNLLKTLIAGYGAKKLGGGCISTILIFIIIFWLLGRL
jgi:hypothetical protein